MKNNTNVSSQIQQFYSEEFGSLEVLLLDGKPYFPATECARYLGYKDPFDAIKRHTKGSVKRRVLTGGGEQDINFIPEGDLYRLIIRSKLPSAERFEEWVFDTVLPSIRKLGAYIMPDTLEEMVTSPEFAIALLKELQKERDKNSELTPKARFYDKVLKSKSVVPISLVAKDYGMSAASFNNLLHDYGIQYKIAGCWLPYQEYAGRGYTKTRTYHYGEEAVSLHTCWTQLGRIFLYDFLAGYGIFPLAELLDEVPEFTQPDFGHGGADYDDHGDDDELYGCELAGA